ncbi:MAG: hypothetical protein AB1921_17400 [Thermodesulfobacteriota bacterium]
MEERVRRLEIEVKRLSEELARIRAFVKMPEPAAATREPLLPDQQELLDALSQEGAGSRVQPMEKMRKKMGWDDRRFEDAVTGLSRQGKVVLHESDATMLSLSKMKQGVIGDGGRMFTGITLA